MSLQKLIGGLFVIVSTRLKVGNVFGAVENLENIGKWIIIFRVAPEGQKNCPIFVHSASVVTSEKGDCSQKNLRLS